MVSAFLSKPAKASAPISPTARRLGLCVFVMPAVCLLAR